MSHFLRQHFGFAGLILRAFWQMITGAGRSMVAVLAWRSLSKAMPVAVPAPVLAQTPPRVAPRGMANTPVSEGQRVPAQFSRSVGANPRSVRVRAQEADVFYTPLWLRD